jgi:signal transduction histidine kinase
MALSMGVALLLSGWLQRGITDPVLEVARVAREVQRKRDYSLRARKTTEDEIGQLVDAFNDMLAEAAERTALLHQADRNKDEFLATLAHELRNPLAPIRNAVEILKLRGSDPQIASKALEMMSRQLGQMVRLVDDLLDVSRITTGKLVVRKEPIDLQAVIDSALESTQTFVQGQKHELAIERPQGKLMMEGDFTRLAQVFANLVHNAAKYTTAGGKVGISIRSEENAYVVQVRDSGVGISAEMLPRIFDMFVQAEHGPESLKAGLGVGLTLARRLVELHGGTLAVASSGLGQGSEFTVRLPVATPEVPAVTAPTPARRGAVPHRVLVADDNEDFVTSMSTLLRGAGHDVRVAKDGVEALEVAEQFEPEFAFIDIGMPRLNGYDVAKRLREQTTQTMLIAITGWGQEEDRRRAHAAGFHRHLTKPVDPAEIESILASQ